MPSKDASSASVQAVGNSVLTVIGESLVDIISDPRRPEEIQAHRRKPSQRDGGVGPPGPADDPGDPLRRGPVRPHDRSAPAVQ